VIRSSSSRVVLQFVVAALLAAACTVDQPSPDESASGAIQQVTTTAVPATQVKLPAPDEPPEKVSCWEDDWPADVDPTCIKVWNRTAVFTGPNKLDPAGFDLKMTGWDPDLELLDGARAPARVRRGGDGFWRFEWEAGGATWMKFSYPVTAEEPLNGDWAELSRKQPPFTTSGEVEVRFQHNTDDSANFISCNNTAFLACTTNIQSDEDKMGGGVLVQTLPVSIRLLNDLGDPVETRWTVTSADSLWLDPTGTDLVEGGQLAARSAGWLGMYQNPTKQPGLELETRITSGPNLNGRPTLRIGDGGVVTCDARKQQSTQAYKCEVTQSGRVVTMRIAAL